MKIHIYCVIVRLAQSDKDFSSVQDHDFLLIKSCSNTELVYTGSGLALWLAAGDAGLLESCRIKTV